jgi:hypothetical protein
MRKLDLPTIREIVDKNRKEREKERKKTKERTSVFRKKLNEY